MNIYISCPWGFQQGLPVVKKYILTQQPDATVTYSEKGEPYSTDNLHQADCIVFILNGYTWQEKLETMSKGMLSELVWCINHRKPIYLAYKASTGLGIYGAIINEDLIFGGVANSSNNLFTIIQNLEKVKIKDTSVDDWFTYCRNKYNETSYFY